jgi:ATP/maltotriose-dependent transcriptional regulator MalT
MLNEGLQCKLTLISAPAGFGKTTLISEWIAGCNRPVAWLSLDEGDSDPVRFISYLVAALQTIQVGIGESVLAAFEIETKIERPTVSVPGQSALVEPLTPRELEVLQLIAEGLSNQEIGTRLFLALDTVKGHNRRIFEKLQVQRRTEAIARARELSLL